jgi:hypothetical protein
MKLVTRLFMGALLLVSACSSPVVEVPSLDPSTFEVSSKLATIDNSQLLFVNLKINPEIDLLIGPNSEVVAVIAHNEDGEILIADLTLVGMNVEAALALILEEALAAGYLPETTEDLVEITYAVSGEDEQASTTLESVVAQAIKAGLENKAIFAIALNRMVIDNTIIEAAKVANLSIDEYLLKMLSQTIGYEFDSALNYGQNVSQLVKLLNNINQNTNANENRIRAAQRVQEKLALQLATMTKRMEKIQEHNQLAMDAIIDAMGQDMSGLTPQERVQIRSRLELALELELKLQEQARLMLENAINKVEVDQKINANQELAKLEHANEEARNAIALATRTRLELRTAAMNAIEIAHNAMNRAKESSGNRP